MTELAKTVTPFGRDTTNETMDSTSVLLKLHLPQTIRPFFQG